MSEFIAIIKPDIVNHVLIKKFSHYAFDEKYWAGGCPNAHYKL